MRNFSVYQKFQIQAESSMGSSEWLLIA